MFFVLSWYVEVAVICMPLALLACNGVGFVSEKPSYEKKPHNQIISEHTIERDRYFDSVKDLDT